MKKVFGKILLLLIISLCSFATADVAIDETNFPDANFREYVKGFDQNGDGKLNKAETDAVEAIDCRELKIGSLEGIEHFEALKELCCDDNQLTVLDMSGNPALRVLECNWNQLTDLNVSGNTSLRELRCYSNQLTSLDVSRNTALANLGCDRNPLLNLDVSGNSFLGALTCANCGLESIDLSNNPQLYMLSIDNNKLTSLDVSNNAELQILECGCNQLSGLDVSKNTRLQRLDCNSAQLTSLDVSKNHELEQLRCSQNKLRELDISHAPYLVSLAQGSEPKEDGDVLTWTGEANGNKEYYCLSVDKDTQLIVPSEEGFWPAIVRNYVCNDGKSTAVIEQSVIKLEENRPVRINMTEIFDMYPEHTGIYGLLYSTGEIEISAEVSGGEQKKSGSGTMEFSFPGAIECVISGTGTVYAYFLPVSYLKISTSVSLVDQAYNTSYVTKTADGHSNMFMVASPHTYFWQNSIPDGRDVYKFATSLGPAPSAYRSLYREPPTPSMFSFVFNTPVLIQCFTPYESAYSEFTYSARPMMKYSGTDEYEIWAFEDCQLNEEGIAELDKVFSTSVQLAHDKFLPSGRKIDKIMVIMLGKELTDTGAAGTAHSDELYNQIGHIHWIFLDAGSLENQLTNYGCYLFAHEIGHIVQSASLTAVGSSYTRWIEEGFATFFGEKVAAKLGKPYYGDTAKLNARDTKELEKFRTNLALGVADYETFRNKESDMVQPYNDYSFGSLFYRYLSSKYGSGFYKKISNQFYKSWYKGHESNFFYRRNELNYNADKYFELFRKGLGDDVYTGFPDYMYEKMPEYLTIAPLSSVRFLSDKATAGHDAAITAITAASISKLVMCSGSKEIAAWTEGYTDRGEIRTWNVSYAFTSSGKKTMTFKAFGDDGTESETLKAKITVTKAPEITGVKLAASKAPVKQDVSITVKTNTSAAKLTMYKGSKALKTWTEGYTDKKDVRTWKVSYAFTATGDKKLTFKAFAEDGVESGTIDAEITITEAPKLSSVKFSKKNATVKQQVMITAVTSTNTVKLAMYNDTKAVKTWTEGYTDKDDRRTWKVTYAFTNAGAKTMSFRAVDENGFESEAKTAKITVTAAPKINSVKFTKKSVKVKTEALIIVNTSTTVSKLTMYSGSKVLQTWTKGYTDKGTTRTWKVEYTFTKSGKKTLTFKGKDANGTVSAAREATVEITK